MPVNLKPYQVSFYSKRIHPDTLHIDWNSQTAIKYNCMYLESPKKIRAIFKQSH